MKKRMNKKTTTKVVAGALVASLVVGNLLCLGEAQEVNASEPVATAEGNLLDETGEIIPGTGGENQGETPPTGGTGDQGNEGQGNEGQGNEGQGNEDQGNEGQGTEGQGNEGQGNEDQTGGETLPGENGETGESGTTGEEVVTPVAPVDENNAIENEFPVVETDPTWVGDTVPSWVDANQEYISGNLEVAEQLRLLKMVDDDRVRRAMDAFRMTEDCVEYEEDNILDVFVIYAVKNSMENNFPYEIEFNDQAARDELVAIFNRMTRVNRVDEENLIVRRISYDEVMDEYAFDATQKGAAMQLMNNHAEDLLQEMYDTSILSTLSDEEFAKIEEQIPANISGARRSVLLAGLSLEGKVNYFWGGKSYHIGWDQNWGKQRLITSEGSSSSGSVRNYGMDCSGFVSWAFINAGGDQSVLGYIGNGTANQWANSQTIGWDEVQPGDLVFYKVPNSAGINHVGIVLSSGDEGLKIVHCSSGLNGVTVTGKVGFKYARRPYIYSE
ncbi:NlpC/P60 family protein [Lachnospiraceae bacterium OttesenSCG-928-E19]|nr:NlpC/P60 family protein [Lachnospiraceae bacterium OttesenSCG-928-E19]